MTTALSILYLIFSFLRSCANSGPSLRYRGSNSSYYILSNAKPFISFLSSSLHHQRCLAYGVHMEPPFHFVPKLRTTDMLFESTLPSYLLVHALERLFGNLIYLKRCWFEMVRLSNDFSFFFFCFFICDHYFFA